uniref:beta-ketoacyl synthase N-terminal-like domain-containing protein n=1 Tax=Bradyrhizobium sp. Leaf401 TaxID=2876564 RepID=UPI001E3D18CE
LESAAGIAALYAALASGEERVVVLAGDPRRLRGAMLEWTAPRAAAPVPAAAEPPASALGEVLEEKALHYFKKVLASIIKLPVHRVEAEAPLEQYGLDSVMAMQLTSELETSFGSLSKTLLFEYQTIQALTGHFIENHRDRLVSLLGVEDRTPAPAAAAASPQMRPAGGRRRPARAAPLRAAGNARPTPGALDIAIIGLSGRYPQARNVEEFWRNLREGRDCISEIPKERWDHRLYFDEDKNKPGKTYSKWGGFIEGVDQFDPLFFNISPREAEFMDPQERLFLQCVWDLLESSGNTRRDLKKRYNDRVGVYVGAMYQHYRISGGNPNHEAITSLSTFSGIANRVSSFFDFKGPSIAVDTMCSSAAIAIHMACHDLARGDCRLAIAGGSNLSLHPNKYVGLSQIQLIGSNSNSRSFSAGDGYLPSEVVSAALLKPLHEAVADGDKVLAVIKSTSANHGGRSSAYSMPSVNSLTQLLIDNFEKSNIDPSTIGYVEAAANGLPLADAVEFRALTKAFRTKTSSSAFCAIGSVKSNIGHAEAASAMSQLTKIVLQFQDQALYPSLEPSVPNPDIDFTGSPFLPQRIMSDWSVAKDNSAKHPRRAILNSFGAGGSNVSMILEEYIEVNRVDETEDPKGSEIVIFSAKTADSLRAHIAQTSDYLADHPGTSLSRLAYTLQLKREPMEYRAAVVASSLNELCNILSDYLASPGNGPDKGHKVHLGSISHDEQFVGDLFTDKGATALLTALAREKSYEKIAQLWARGATLPWELLHGNKRLRSLSLPTYPFAKERYWLLSDGVRPSSPSEQNSVTVPDEQRSQHIRLPSTAAAGVKELLSQILKVPGERITAEVRLKDYGFDSLGALMVSSVCESHLMITLPKTDILSCETVRDLTDLIAAHSPSNAMFAASAKVEPNTAAEAKLYASSLQILEQFRDGRLTQTEVERLINESVLG